jgi:putative IMPACT (imprinted ancient) family translation regulator
VPVTKPAQRQKTKHTNSTNTQIQNSNKQHKKYDHNCLSVEFLEIFGGFKKETGDKNK